MVTNKDQSVAPRHRNNQPPEIVADRFERTTADSRSGMTFVSSAQVSRSGVFASKTSAALGVRTFRAFHRRPGLLESIFNGPVSFSRAARGPRRHGPRAARLSRRYTQDESALMPGASLIAYTATGIPSGRPPWLTRGKCSPAPIIAAPGSIVINCSIGCPRRPTYRASLVM